MNQPNLKVGKSGIRQPKFNDSFKQNHLFTNNNDKDTLISYNSSIHQANNKKNIFAMQSFGINHSNKHSSNH